MNASTNASYTFTAKLLHWLMAVMIFGLLALGLYMSDLPLSPQKLQYFSWHKWAGVTVFVLVWLRLVWRITHRPPALPASMSRAQQALAHAGHHGLYLLMVVIPLTGWLMSSAKGFQTVWFGVLPIPDLIGKDKELGHLLENIHAALNWLLMLVLAGHIGAALLHHFVYRDGILQRMGFGSDKT